MNTEEKSDNRLPSDMALMKAACDEYLKKRTVYYIVTKEKLSSFDCWRWEVHQVTSHEVRDGKIIAQSAFWGTDVCDAAMSRIFSNKSEANRFRHRQNCLEVLFNEPEQRESWTWKEDFTKWIPDVLKGNRAELEAAYRRGELED